MCELQSPPTPGEPSYIMWPADRDPITVGEEFTMPWGAWDVTYRVDVARGPGKLTGRERYDCTVMYVKPGTRDD